MKILMISRRYPSAGDGTKHVFVQKLAHALANEGNEVLVVTYPEAGFERKAGVTYTEKTSLGFAVMVSVCSRGTSRFTRALGRLLRVREVDSMYRAASRSVGLLGYRPDVIYGHFLAPSGVIASRLGVGLGVPSFVTYGESSLWSINAYPKAWLREHLSRTSGIIAVSTANQARLVEALEININKVRVIPNAINGEAFYPRAREESRRLFGIDEELFVFSFVGQFIERKGLDLVLEVLEELRDSFIILAGQGTLKIRSSKVLFSGRVEQHIMPNFLSASDCFVLPSRAEGCSNAVLEAIGCEVPIISSDLPFNWDILTKDEALLVDPYSKDELLRAMREIRDSRELRERLKSGMRRRRGSLLYQERTRKILETFREHVWTS